MTQEQKIAEMVALVMAQMAGGETEVPVQKVPGLPNVPNFSAEFYVSAKGEKTGSIKFVHKLQKEVYSNGATKPLMVFFKGMFNGNGTPKDTTSRLLNLKNQRQYAEALLDIVEYYEREMGVQSKELETAQISKVQALKEDKEAADRAKKEKMFLRLKAELGQ